MSLMQSGRLPCPREPPLFPKFHGRREDDGQYKELQGVQEQETERPLCTVRSLVILLVSATVGLLVAIVSAVVYWAKLHAVAGGLGAAIVAVCAGISAWVLVLLNVAGDLNRLVR